jgi:signal transduction histidine kinase
MTRLHSRILLALAAVAAVFFGASAAIQRYAVLPSFLALERNRAETDIGRALEAVQNEIQHVDNFVNDWAGWDDTYQFVQDRNEAYFRSNLESDVFRPDSFDFLCFVRRDGTEVWRGTEFAGEPLTIDELPAPWPDDHPLLAPRDIRNTATGIVPTRHGPLLLASRVITDSERKAPPRGWIMMGRFLDADRVAALGNQIHLDVAITPMSAVATPADLTALARLRAGQSVDITPRGDDRIVATALIPALTGDGGLLVAVTMPRAILREAQVAMAYAQWSMLLAVIALFVAIYWLVQRLVVRPLERLSRHALLIRDTDDLTLRSGFRRRDEIGTLAREFDDTVSRLAASRTERVGRAREGGKAEVAAEVLHDIGNAIQSVQTSSDELQRRIGGPLLGQLERFAALLADHRGDLATWLRDDPQGQQVPAYVLALADSLARDRRELRGEADALAEGLRHIEALLARQNQHTGVRAAPEIVELAELLRQAEHLARPRGGGSAVAIACPDARLSIEKHVVLSALVNLLTNAHEATARIDHEGRPIRLAAELTEAGVRLSVTDQGIGIPPDDLVRIFQRGHSTKAGSAGLGLHGSANSISAIGGRIHATSDGPGHGATFTIELPPSVLVAEPALV